MKLTLPKTPVRESDDVFFFRPCRDLSLCIPLPTDESVGYFLSPRRAGNTTAKFYRRTLRAVIVTAFMSLSAPGQELTKPETKTSESADQTSAGKVKTASKAKIDGEAFLAQNAKAEGVTVLPDGLQYRVMREGAGATPTTNDLIFIKYRGKFIEGGEFDHQNHFLTRTTGGIKGWQEALQRMRVGSKWQIFVPSELAFADEGDPYLHIAPDATLIYELELISIAQPGDPQIGTGSLGHGLSGDDTR